MPQPQKVTLGFPATSRKPSCLPGASVVKHRNFAILSVEIPATCKQKQLETPMLVLIPFLFSVTMLGSKRMIVPIPLFQKGLFFRNLLGTSPFS
jgi:hypothetical protein